MQRDWARLGLLAMLMQLAIACVQPDDDPSSVRDLRVLGMQVDPPELMAPVCFGSSPSTAQQALAAFAVPVQLRVLIADPGEEGREIAYELSACAKPSDRTCTETPEQRVLLYDGTTQAGEFSRTLVPAVSVQDDGNPLLLSVFNEDIYKGLGGLRMPLVLHLTAGEEEIYAMKLMVFSCKLFPDSKPNLLPQLPGVFLEDEPWTVEEPPTVNGDGDVRLSLDSLEVLEEDFVVPSFSLEPVQLTESWRVSWYTTSGTIAPATTGGVDIGGQASRHNVTWSPAQQSEPTDVTFYMVARDGRGGDSWITRSVHFVP